MLIKKHQVNEIWQKSFRRQTVFKITSFSSESGGEALNILRNTQVIAKRKKEYKNEEL